MKQEDLDRQKGRLSRAGDDLSAGMHPEPHKLESFMRAEGLPREEVCAIVRHLLTGCPQCLIVTRRLWGHGEQPLLLKAMAEATNGTVIRCRLRLLEADGL